MEQEEITKIYETLAPMAGDYMNAQAEQIGAAQQSIGPLAANTMGATTSGLGNYTYNRLMRPQVDVMRDQILVQGYANQLNRALSDRLNAARNRYNKRVGGSGGGTPATTTITPSTWNGEFETDATGDNLVRHEQTDRYELFTVKGPDYPTGIQWKIVGTNGGGYDNPYKSYDLTEGSKELGSLIRRGNRIYNVDGEDITSRFTK